MADNPLSRFKQYKKWDLERLIDASAELCKILPCPVPMVTNSPTRYKQATGYNVGRALGRTCHSPFVIYVGTRKRSTRSKWAFREPGDVLGILIHEFVHLTWPNMPHGARFSGYVRRIYDGDIPKKRMAKKGEST